MALKHKLKEELNRFADNGLNLMLISIITGLFAGVLITFYSICASYGEEFSQAMYKLLLENPAFIPLLFVALAAGAVVIGTLVKFVPMIRGSGIPQIEGAARGKFGFRWYTVMCSMFAASLACIFLGLAAGSEGPSIEIGGCAGEAVGKTLKRTHMVRRLQIAGGASAGFAVAFNAPVTGMVFAMEEAFKSLSPQVFISSAAAVLTALGVRTGIRSALGMSIGFSFDGFVFTQMDWAGCGFVVLAANVVALAAVAFYHLMLKTKKLFKKITFLKGVGKYIIPFVLSGAFGLITVYAMGGGHGFISALATGGTGEISIESVWGLGLLASLAVIVLIRFVSMTLVMGCGVPCGVFIPMLAVGAGLGAILSLLFRSIGFDPAFTDFLIIICMATFFTTFVRAPLTGLFMVFELTGQVANLFPALLGVLIGYFVSELFKLEPGYELCLRMFIEEEGFYKNNKKVRVTARIMEGSKADGGKVRKIIWPSNGLVVELSGENGAEVPDGETILHAGQTITFECETSDEEELMDYLYDIVGRPER
ncbi:MAG: chloride channel protein [Candidatus Coproplasma sp.]